MKNKQPRVDDGTWELYSSMGSI